MTEPAKRPIDYDIEVDPDEVDYALEGIEPPHKRTPHVASPVRQIDPALEGSVDMLIDWADGWVDDLLLHGDTLTEEEVERKELAAALLQDARACPESIPELCAMAHLVGRTPREALDGIEASVRARKLPSQRLAGGR